MHASIVLAAPQAWKAQLKGFDAELQVQEQRLATLESSSQVEVAARAEHPSSLQRALHPVLIPACVFASGFF